MRPSATLNLQRSAIRAASSRHRVTNPRVFGSVVPVDVLTPGDLPKKFSDQVLAQAQPL
jgi:predicted nucleotidyltransferase